MKKLFLILVLILVNIVPSQAQITVIKEDGSNEIYPFDPMTIGYCSEDYSDESGWGCHENQSVGVLSINFYTKDKKVEAKIALMSNAWEKEILSNFAGLDIRCGGKTIYLRAQDYKADSAYVNEVMDYKDNLIYSTVTVTISEEQAEQLAIYPCQVSRIETFFRLGPMCAIYTVNVTTDLAAENIYALAAKVVELIDSYK